MFEFHQYDPVFHPKPLQPGGPCRRFLTSQKCLYCFGVSIVLNVQHPLVLVPATFMIEGQIVVAVDLPMECIEIQASPPSVVTELK